MSRNLPARPAKQLAVNLVEHHSRLAFESPLHCQSMLQAEAELILDVQISTSSPVSAEINLWRLLDFMDCSRMRLGLITWGLP